MNIIIIIIIITFLYWEYTRMWENATSIRTELEEFKEATAKEIIDTKHRLSDLSDADNYSDMPDDVRKFYSEKPFGFDDATAKEAWEHAKELKIEEDTRETVTIKLPSFPKNEVILYKGLLTHQVQNIIKVESDYDKGLEILKTMIKSWTLTDKKGKTLAVSNKSIKLLPTKDFTVLMDEVNKEFETVNVKKITNRT